MKAVISFSYEIPLSRGNRLLDHFLSEVNSLLLLIKVVNLNILKAFTDNVKFYSRTSKNENSWTGKID